MPFKLGPLEVVLMLVIFFVVVLPIIIALIVVFARSVVRKNTKSAALDIAEQRYARGEITEAQLQEIRKNLSG
jgi:uncharacterized membrane protein